MRYFTFIIIFLGLSVGGLIAQEGMPSSSFWPDGKTAAVCLTYDDGLDCHLDLAAPSLEGFGFRGTFYCTGFSSSLYKRMKDWKAMAAMGHELGNHTLFHPCHGDKFEWIRPEYDLNSYTFPQLMDELKTANSLLKAVDGLEERSFAYTCTNHTIQGVSFSDSIKGLFPAARGGGGVPESMSEVDIYYVPSWGVIDPTGGELIAFVEEALAKGTLAVFMFHSVGGGYLNVSKEAHSELLEYLNASRDRIWTDTFLNVMKHVIKQRSGI